MNVFPKFGFSVALRLTILCCGMLFGAAAVQAQSSFDPTPNELVKAGGVWLNSVAALDVLQAEITGIDQTLSYSQPSNAIQLKMKMELYIAIAGSIQDGLEVSKAAHLHFNSMAPSSHTDVAPTSGMQASDWAAIYTDMIALLMN